MFLKVLNLVQHLLIYTIPSGIFLRSAIYRQHPWLFPGASQGGARGTRSSQIVFKTVLVKSLNQERYWGAVRQAAVNSCIIISIIICACVSKVSRFQLGKLVQKLVSESEKSCFQTLEIQTLPRGACIWITLGGLWPYACGLIHHFAPKPKKNSPQAMHPWLFHWSLWFLRNQNNGNAMFVIGESPSIVV